MRLIELVGVALTGVLAAGSAAALVTINHVATSPTLVAIGDAVTIQVRVSWDGAPGLFGVFSSTSSSDATVAIAESAVSGANFYRGSLFAFTDDETGASTSLGRFGQNQLRQSVDGLNVVRSVQYGSLDPIDPRGAASNVLVTTITFRVIGPGLATIGYFQALGDTGALGDQIVAGAPIVVGWVPEPGTALLTGLGLAGLSLSGRRS